MNGLGGSSLSSRFWLCVERAFTKNGRIDSHMKRCLVPIPDLIQLWVQCQSELHQLGDCCLTAWIKCVAVTC